MVGMGYSSMWIIHITGFAASVALPYLSDLLKVQPFTKQPNFAR